MKNTKHAALLLVVVFTTSSAIAQEPVKKASPFRFVVGGALEMGGDRVAEVYFTNGNSQSVRAGQGGSIVAGGQLALDKAEQFLLRGTVGYKYVTTEADNVHVRLTRVPIILTANYMVADKLRLGAGVSMHRAINFNADGIGDNMKFEGATGPTFEITYAGVGLMYTAMKYKDNLANTYSSNAFGVSFSFVFPSRQRTTVAVPVDR